MNPVARTGGDVRTVRSDAAGQHPRSRCAAGGGERQEPDLPVRRAEAAGPETGDDGDAARFVDRVECRHRELLW